MLLPGNTEPAPRRMLSPVGHEKLRAGHSSRRTEAVYLDWIRRYIRFHGGRRPRELREPAGVAFGKDLAGPVLRAHKSGSSFRKNRLCPAAGLW